MGGGSRQLVKFLERSISGVHEVEILVSSSEPGLK